MNDVPVRYIQTKNEYIRAVNTLEQAKIVGIDTEFSNLDVYRSRLLLVSIYDGNISYVFDFTKLDIELLKELKPILESSVILKVGHNLTAEWKQFYHHARIKMQYMHDTMVADQLIFAGLPYKFGLKDVALRRLNIDMDKQIRTEFIDWPVDATFTQEQINYSGMDAVIPIDIYQQQMPEIEDMKLCRIYDLEMKILAPTAKMEYNGVPINKATLEAMVEPFHHYIQTANQAFQDILIENGAATTLTFSKDGYQTININSGDQVKAALQRIGIDIRDSKGKSSLNSKVVQRWDMLQSLKTKGKKYKDWQIDYHSIIKDTEVANALDLYLVLNNKILRAYAFVQGAEQLYSTFIIGLLNAINPITGRIHPGFRSLGAHRTGRFSSAKPNFQNLPNDDKLMVLGLGRYSIRKAIEAPKGRKLVIADFAGIELVILAALSGEEKLLDQILRGDIHTFVTREVLGYKEITPENKGKNPHKMWRKASKTLSYGIAYGTTGRNIAETLNIMLGSTGYKITPEQGDELIAKWFSLFPKTAAYLKSNADKAVQDRFVTDAWGRRRNWSVNMLIDKWQRLAAGREGMNAPIQGTSATMTKLATWYLWEALDQRRARMIITVHDELVFEVVDNYADIAVAIIKEKMQQSIADLLPIIADEIGKHEGTSVDPKISQMYDK